MERTDAQGQLLLVKMVTEVIVQIGNKKQLRLLCYYFSEIMFLQQECVEEMEISLKGTGTVCFPL